MYRVHEAAIRTARLVVPVLAACGWGAVQAQGISPNYTLTTPWLLAEPELSPQVSPLAIWGPVRFSAGHTSTGSGLSMEAGRNWFARAGIGRSVASELNLGGGYRFEDGEALSMMVTRQLGQERLGLAVRYDWRQAYLRLSYDHPLRPMPGEVDRLRFSAGVRF